MKTAHEPRRKTRKRGPRERPPQCPRAERPRQPPPSARPMGRGRTLAPFSLRRVRRRAGGGEIRAGGGEIRGGRPPETTVERLVSILNQ